MITIAPRILRLYCSSLERARHLLPDTKNPNNNRLAMKLSIFVTYRKSPYSAGCNSDVLSTDTPMPRRTLRNEDMNNTDDCLMLLFIIASICWQCYPATKFIIPLFWLKWHHSAPVIKCKFSKIYITIYVVEIYPYVRVSDRQ